LFVQPIALRRQLYAFVAVSSRFGHEMKATDCLEKAIYCLHGLHGSNGAANEGYPLSSLCIFRLRGRPSPDWFAVRPAGTNRLSDFWGSGSALAKIRQLIPDGDARQGVFSCIGESMAVISG
jgi:hypothetical protein